VRGLVAAGRVVAILRLRPEITDPAGPAEAPAAGSVLHDPVSGLTVRAGELVGLAAADPAEAAELADRIGGYRAEAEPELGGIPLHRLPVDVVRSRVLVATNDAHLFAGRFDEQLAAGRPAAGQLTSSDQVLAAVRAAAADDVLDAVGLDGELAARGRTLSGGQAQRVRLARALLAEPEILVLVEPTSAVDAHTEAAIARQLRSARPGVATVVVSNSPLLLDQADWVAYLRDGTVTATGTHRDLIASDASYASTVTREGGP
jgi:ABC-type multidrug transport system fused ATPase/permease subunit